jgi:hypothetical protein
MWLVIHHPKTRSDLGSQVSYESRESLFITSIEVAEFVRLIKEDENTKKWSWMFDTHIQWHAIAMVLSELCVRPLSPLTNRAWLAVTTVYDDWLQTANRRKGMLWRPLAQLMKRAGALREKQLAELRAHAGNQHISAHTPNPTTTDSDRPSIGSPFSTHFPEHSRLVAAAPPMDLDPPQGPLDFDLSQGPMDVLSQFFPEGNWFATPEAQTAPQAPANLHPSLSMPNESPTATSQGPSNLGTSHHGWDQVLRGFQLDTPEKQANPMGDITGWVT